MIENDTIKLLRECDAGVKMGIDSIEEVFSRVENRQLKQLLSDCRDEHEKLDKEITAALDRFHDEGKKPNPMAKGMAHIKTEVKIMVEESDATIADLMTDGCNMGVKSLSRYLNEYAAADEAAKDIAKRLIKSEAELAEHIREYL